jgi:two-component system KDP operon response regulator KdpE
MENTQAGKAPRVLLIEADAVLLRLFSLELTSAGFQVASAADCDEGLSQAKDAIPDLVYVDMESCGEDGLTTFKRLRVPVILGASPLSEQVLVASLEEGADEVLLKPVDAEALEHAAQCLLSVTALDPALRNFEQDGVLYSRTEQRLLKALVSNPGEPVLHRELISKVWGALYQDYVAFLQAWMTRLIRKVRSGQNGVQIADFLGVGYALGPNIHYPNHPE